MVGPQAQGTLPGLPVPLHSALWVGFVLHHAGLGWAGSPAGASGSCPVSRPSNPVGGELLVSKISSKSSWGQLDMIYQAPSPEPILPVCSLRGEEVVLVLERRIQVPGHGVAPFQPPFSPAPFRGRERRHLSGQHGKIRVLSFGKLWL